MCCESRLETHISDAIKSTVLFFYLITVLLLLLFYILIPNG